MTPLVQEMKDRLRRFLADPESKQEFRVWFALALRDVHKANDNEAESLAHAVQRAFSDAGLGYYTPEQLRSVLSSLADPTMTVVPVAVEVSQQVLRIYPVTTMCMSSLHDLFPLGSTATLMSGTLYAAPSPSGSIVPALVDDQPGEIVAA